MSFETDLVSTIQQRLAVLGYYRLKIDGDYGSGTSNAVINFKQSHGLKARDYIGPITMSVMFSETAKPWAPVPTDVNDPRWVTEAKSLLGTREVKGTGDNPIIMGWAVDLDQWYPNDDTPWCGLFAAHCFTAGAPQEPQGFNRLGAREWLKFGVDPLNGGDPVTADLPYGACAIFWRTHKTKSWNGHVAPVITAQNRTHVRVIGGNQSDNVTEAWFSRDRLLGVRVPAGYTGRSAQVASTGSLSTSES